MTTVDEIVQRLTSLKAWLGTNLDYMEDDQETCQLAIDALIRLNRDLHNLMGTVKAEDERLQALAEELGVKKPEDRQGYTGPHTPFSVIAAMRPEPITKENVLWSVLLQTPDGYPNHCAMGKGWDALREAVVNMKAKANEDHADVVKATWIPAVDIECRWEWNSAKDAPAYLPQWQD